MKLPIVTPDDGNEDNVADKPAENRRPLRESLLPTMEGTPPTMEGTPPARDSKLPKLESSLPTLESSLPTLESAKPRSSSKLSTMESPLPKRETSLPRLDHTAPLYQVGTAEAIMQNDERSKKLPLVIIAVILGLIAAVYVGFSIYFMSHYTFNSTVNGVSIAFKTAAEVNDNLQAEIERYTLLVEAREDQQATITASQIDLRYLDTARMENALENQQPWAWPIALIFKSAANIQHVNVEYDHQKLADTLASIVFLDEEQMRPPTNAALAFENHAYVIVEADEGTTLNIAATTKAITEAIYAGESALSLEELELYARSEVPSDDDALVTDRDTFNQYVPFKITYIFGDNREVLDGYTTINWVNTEGDAPYELNFEAVAAWVAELAARYNTLEGPRGIVNGFGEQKHVEGGTFGWMLDQESECWAIMNASAHRLGEEREAHWLTHGITFGDNDWGGTYLQVDMTRQYMWYYVDGVCVLETDVITGNPNTGYATPQGVWYIYNKSMYVTARGDLLPNGTYRWETPLTYWMPFTPSGCGFHDAYWQPSFGGQHYLYRGSHGCINMPPHLAAELYEMLEPGTPVITHF